MVASLSLKLFTASAVLTLQLAQHGVSVLPYAVWVWSRGDIVSSIHTCYPITETLH